MAVNYGYKRQSTGAGYGFGDWLIQRITAVLIAVFVLLVLLQVLMPGAMDYYRWAGIFSSWWMKGLTFATVVALVYHAWVGVRDIWMDYVQPTAIRLTLHTLTIVWLLICLGWALQILWRL